MQLDQNPFFRKPITPWYDANVVCWAVVIFSVAVFLFAVQGIFIAANDPVLAGYLWFPFLLAGLTFFLSVKVVLRVQKRKKNS